MWQEETTLAPASVAYLEQLTVSSLLRSAASILSLRIGQGAPREGAAAKAVRYFDAKRFTLALARALLRLLGAEPPQRVDFILGELRESDGSATFPTVWRDTVLLARRIAEREVKGTPWLATLSGRFDPRRLLLFVEKGLANDLESLVVFAHAARLHAAEHAARVPDVRPDGAGNARAPIFIPRKRPYAGYIREFLEGKGFVVYGCERSKAAGRAAGAEQEVSQPATGNAAGRAPRASQAGPEKPIPQRLAAPGLTQQPRRAIAHWYTGRTLSFEKARRSEFFWLADTEGLRERLLVCFESPPTAEVQRRLEELHLPWAVRPSVAEAARAAVTPGSRGKRLRHELGRGLAIALKAAARAASARVAHPGRLLLTGIRYTFTYALWLEFFKRHRIAVSMNQNDMSRMHLPMADALADSGGVSVTHQWSNLKFPNLAMANSSDVLFAFSPAYRWFWEATDTAVKRLVYVGYITDHAFAPSRPAAQALRDRLRAAGADLIVCFFDENSSDNRMSVISNARTVRIHRELLEGLLADESLGLILKPAYPATFRERMAPIAGLLAQAEATGRLIIVEKAGGLKTDAYPAETAQAADLAVGLLMSGTVALEAHLAGTPTVFLDLEAADSELKSGDGVGTRVFDRAASVLATARKWAADPASVPGFGDLTEWTRRRVFIADGKAAARIGGYVHTLLTSLEEGASPEAAIGVADALHRKAWGAESVERLA